MSKQRTNERTNGVLNQQIPTSSREKSLNLSSFRLQFSFPRGPRGGKRGLKEHKKSRKDAIETTLRPSNATLYEYLGSNRSRSYHHNIILEKSDKTRRYSYESSSRTPPTGLSVDSAFLELSNRTNTHLSNATKDATTPIKSPLLKPAPLYPLYTPTS